MRETTASSWLRDLTVALDAAATFEKCVGNKPDPWQVDLLNAMAAGGEGQGDIALTQPFQRGKRLFSKTMVRHQQGAVHIKCRQFCHGIFPDV